MHLVARLILEDSEGTKCESHDFNTLRRAHVRGHDGRGSGEVAIDHYRPLISLWRPASFLVHQSEEMSKKMFLNLWRQHCQHRSSQLLGTSLDCPIPHLRRLREGNIKLSLKRTV